MTGDHGLERRSGTDGSAFAVANCNARHVVRGEVVLPARLLLGWEKMAERAALRRELRAARYAGASGLLRDVLLLLVCAVVTVGAFTLGGVLLVRLARLVAG